MKRTNAACRHCRRRKAVATRRLCYPCFHNRAIRDIYPPTINRFAVGVPGHPVDFEGPAPLAAEPTTALPGTAEKVAVMTARAAAGVELFHPDDWPAGIGRLLEMVG